jgi:ribulose-phosphate 3-epimerase
LIVLLQIEPFLEAASSPAAAAVAAGALAADIRGRGMRAAVALSVGTGVDAVLPLLQDKAVDMVLCMTVECGFGGQKFQEQVLDKVRNLRRTAHCKQHACRDSQPCLIREV